jgi:glycosyltransferase involved in cell wall biosynthesis
VHIVFLNVTGSLGGAERVLLTLVRALRNLRPQWRLTVVMGDCGPLEEAVLEAGGEPDVLAFPDALKVLGDWGVVSKIALAAQIGGALPAVMRYRTALRQKLLALAPDVVQSNGFKMHLLGTLACPRGARLIWHVHDFVSNRPAMRTLLRWCSGEPQYIAAISTSVAEDLKSVVRNPASVRTVWNAIDFARIAVAPAIDRFAPSVAYGARIGLVATFARWKGHEVFLHALSMLPEDLHWQASIIGGQVYSRGASQFSQAELRELCERLGLESRVEFTGFLANPALAIETLDIVVHASTDPEPFGLVIAEGMAAEKAVVTSSDSLITDEVDGLLHKRGDPADLARVLERLLRDTLLRARLGVAARATAERRFQPARMAQEFMELYR